MCKERMSRIATHVNTTQLAVVSATDLRRILLEQQPMSMGAEIQQSPAAERAEAGLEPCALCFICQQHRHKYKCPGCQAQTCSLACSKQHKQQTGCSGQRDKFAFVPMQQFSDKHLLSDYRWLEEVSRADSNARRHRPPTPRRELPQHLSQLVHQAKYRGVRLLIMSPGMQKRQQNSTRYEYRARKMHWRIEWRFPAAAAAAAADAAHSPIDLNHAHSHPKPYVVTDGRVDEETVINKILSVHLEYQPGAGGQALALRRYREAGINKLVILMRKERCPANAIRYYRIDFTQTLRSQLAGKVIIEYPSLIVLLPGEESSYDIVSLEEQQAEQQAGFGGRYGTGFRQQQQQQQMLPPPPPPPQSGGPQQQQQQQQGAAEESAAKRQCIENGRSDTAAETIAAAAADGAGVAAAAAAVNGAAVAGAGGQSSIPFVGQQQLQQQPAGNAPENDCRQQQQLQQQQLPKEQDKDPAPQQQQLGEDDQQQQQPKYYYYDPTDGADEDAADFLAGLDKDDDSQQQQGHVNAADTADGRATVMALLGHYDEHEIEID